MSSQAGSVVLHGESTYCMTKAAINHLTRCLASEWAPHGITVNSVAPTFIYTDATAPALSDPGFKRRTLAHIPIGRILDPKDVAAAGVPGLAGRLAHHRRKPAGRCRVVGRRHEIGVVDANLACRKSRESFESGRSGNRV
jgi:NAD(P)-dependent dehydrogenase (short-subunit alcohol dehydrogenase family)